MDKNKRKKGRSRNNKKVDSHTRINVNKNESIFQVLKGLHITQDLPYRVMKSNIMGRYLVAGKDLAAGELIIEEDPLVIGPSQQCGLVCLGCYCPIQIDTIVRCLKCKWPLCCLECKGLYSPIGHSTMECELLSRNSSSNHSLHYDYEPITPLRCLTLKQTHPPNWEILCSMEDHNDIRRTLPNIWDGNQTNIVNIIRNKWNIVDYTELEIHTVCGILETNAFDVSHNGSKARALYSSSFLFSHNCVPNTTHTNDHNYHFKIRTSVPVPRNQTLTLTYTYIIEGTLKRREHIKASKFFDCFCARCKDPSELKTWTSALVCPQCNEATVISTNPLDGDAAWTCRKSSCDFYLSAESVHKLLNKLSLEVKALDPNNVKAHEMFLETYKTTLHRNHHYNLWVNHSLAQMYGKVEGYMMFEMNDDLLLKKISVCEHLLSVINILDPGMSRLRGVLLYELHAPLMVRISRNSQAGNISKPALKNQLRKVISCLKEAVSILSFECPTTQEGQMASAAREALTEIYNWEKYVGKL